MIRAESRETLARRREMRMLALNEADYACFFIVREAKPSQGRN